MGRAEGRTPPPPPPRPTTMMPPRPTTMMPPPPTTMMPPPPALDPVFFGHHSVMPHAFIPQQPPPYGPIYPQPPLPQQYIGHSHHRQNVPIHSHQPEPYYGSRPPQQSQPYGPYPPQQGHPYNPYYHLPQLYHNHHDYQPQSYDDHYSDEGQAMSQQFGSLRIGHSSLIHQSTVQAPIDPTTSQSQSQPTMASGQLPSKAPKNPGPMPPHLAGLPPPTCQAEMRTLKASGLPHWMNENDFGKTTRKMSGVAKISIPRGKDMKSQKLGYIEFHTRAMAEAALNAHNGTYIAGSEYKLALEWSTYVPQEFQLYCTNFPADISNDQLRDIFKPFYPSVKRAFILKHDRGNRYGFVCFLDDAERRKALHEMAGRKGLVVRL